MIHARIRHCSSTMGAMICAFFAGASLLAQTPAKVDFARDIQPLFRDHCIECHGASQQMRGLRLDRRRDAMPNRVGANGARIVPGDSAQSPLYRRVSAKNSAQMPPSAPLRPEQINLIKAWIDQGADWPDELSGDRDTTPADPAAIAIMNALRNGDRQGFTRVLRENPDSVNDRGASGWTPLMYAAIYGDSEAVRLLLVKGANPNTQNNHGGTALMYATDSEEKTRLLLDHGSDPNLRSGEGRTAILVAVGRAGAYPVVKLLLERGADGGARLPDGRGALSLAVNARDPKLLQLLLDNGADKKRLPLAPLLVAGCPGCFDLLLPFAEPADLAVGLQGAVRTGDLPRIKALLDRGARPGGNLLQVIAASPAAIPVETIRSLIVAGADVNAKTSTGLTLSEFANRHGNAAVLEALAGSVAPGERSTLSQPRRKPAPSVRAALERTLPALQRADVAFLQKAGCVSCHNNSLTAMTMASARSKGLRVNEQIAQNQSRKIAAFLQENAERALENEGLPGAVDTVSYILMGLAVDGYPSDPVTDAWARYVKNNQSLDGRWTCTALRPPIESSDFQVTAASIKSLKAFGPKSRRLEYDKAVEQAVHWLEAAQASSTEDLAFQIQGLIWGGGNPAKIRGFTQALAALQRSDGGWSQTRTLASDAYATGQALVALNEARAVATTTPAYRRGIQYLLNSQLEDGSWHVVTRAAAIQPYFDSEFPHGPDQFISAAASNWASMALMTVVR
jgi:ankyrin repeat protein